MSQKGIDWSAYNDCDNILCHCRVMVGEERQLTDEEIAKFNDRIAEAKKALVGIVMLADTARERYAN